MKGLGSGRNSTMAVDDGRVDDGANASVVDAVDDGAKAVAVQGHCWDYSIHRVPEVAAADVRGVHDADEKDVPVQHDHGRAHNCIRSGEEGGKEDAPNVDAADGHVRDDEGVHEPLKDDDATEAEEGIPSEDHGHD